MIRALIVISVLLGGCAVLGVPSPETPTERQAAVEIAYQGALNTIDGLRERGIIHAGNSDEVIAAVLVAGQAVRASRLAVSQDSGDALAWITAATAAVLELTNLLQEREGTNAGCVSDYPNSRGDYDGRHRWCSGRQALV